MSWFSTIFGVLKTPLQYEHYDCGVFKRRIGEDFGKTRGSTIVVLNWNRAFDGLQRVEACILGMVAGCSSPMSAGVRPLGVALISC